MLPEWVRYSIYPLHTVFSSDTQDSMRDCVFSEARAGPMVPLSSSSTTCRLNSAVKVLGFLIDRLLSIPFGTYLALSEILTTLTHFVQL